jgi:hypothetical protein
MRGNPVEFLGIARFLSLFEMTFRINAIDGDKKAPMQDAQKLWPVHEDTLREIIGHSYLSDQNSLLKENI